jgi:hypothetical protein
MTGSNAAILIIIAMIGGGIVAGVITWFAAVEHVGNRVGANEIDDALRPTGRHRRADGLQVANAARYNEQATASAYYATGPMPVVTAVDDEPKYDLAAVMPVVIERKRRLRADWRTVAELLLGPVPR